MGKNLQQSKRKRNKTSAIIQSPNVKRPKIDERLPKCFE